MLLRYMVSPVTVQGHASDYKVHDTQKNHLSSPFILSSPFSLSGIISQPLCHHLHFIHHYFTPIQPLLAQIISIVTLSIHLGFQICSDCLYHTGISLLLTLLIYSTAIGPWNESVLTPTTTYCLTWAFTYRSAPLPFHYLQYSWSPPQGFNIQVAAEKVIKTQSSAWRAWGPPYLFCWLNISIDSKCFVLVTLERAWHIHNLSPVSDSSERPWPIHHHSPFSDSPEPCLSIVGLLDSPFIPGDFVHSTPPQDCFLSYLISLVQQQNLDFIIVS